MDLILYELVDPTGKPGKGGFASGFGDWSSWWDKERDKPQREAGIYWKKV